MITDSRPKSYRNGEQMENCSQYILHKGQEHAGQRAILVGAFV